MFTRSGAKRNFFKVNIYCPGEWRPGRLLLLALLVCTAEFSLTRREHRASGPVAQPLWSRLVLLGVNGTGKPQNSHTVSGKDAKALHGGRTALAVGGAGATGRPQAEGNENASANVSLMTTNSAHEGETGEHGRVPRRGSKSRSHMGEVDNADLVEVKTFGPAKDRLGRKRQAAG